MRDVVYLVSPAGNPNFGNEAILAGWLRFLARARPDAPVLLDCPHPASALALFDGMHPNFGVTDALWRTCARSPRQDAAGVGVCRIARPDWNGDGLRTANPRGIHTSDRRRLHQRCLAAPNRGRRRHGSCQRPHRRGVVRHRSGPDAGLPGSASTGVRPAEIRPHLSAAACGAAGTALGVAPGYYDVKHRSLQELDTGWRYAGLESPGELPHPAANPSFPDQCHGSTAAKQAEALSLYGLSESSGRYGDARDTVGQPMPAREQIFAEAEVRTVDAR